MPENILKGTIQITAPGVQQTFATVNTGVTNLERSLQRSDQAIQKSKTNFTGLSRVVQDLPFGFIAISNNLEQLLPAAGGAGLAFSALISVLSFAQIGFANWTRGLGSSKQSLKDQVEALHKAKEALSDFVETMDAVNKSRVIGAQNAQEDLLKLQELHDAIANTNIPIAKRKELVDQLQEQYPKYFGNIKDEIILAGGAEDAYKKLAAAILTASNVRAFNDTITELRKEDIAVSEKQLAQNQKEFDSFQKMQAAKQRSLSAAGSTPEFIESAANEAAAAESNYNSIVKEGNTLQKQRIDNLQTRTRLAKEVAGIIQENPDGITNPGGKVPKTGGGADKSKTEFLFELLPFDPTGKLKPEQKAAVVSAADKFEKEFGNILEGVHFRAGAFNQQDIIDNANQFWKDFKEGLIKVKPPSIVIGKDDIPVVVEFDNSQIDKFTSAVNNQLSQGGPDGIKLTPEMELEFEKLKIKADQRKKLQQIFKEAVQSAFSSAATEGFAGIGESIGAAIAAGANPIAAAGQSILGALGDLISQIGKALIEYGVVKEGLDKILVGGIAIPGIAAIALGVSAVAIGALIKSSFKKIPGFATGGEVPPGYPNDTFLARLTSGEKIIPAGQSTRLAPAMASGGSERLVAEISGDMLRLVLQRANAQGRLFR